MELYYLWASWLKGPEQDSKFIMHLENEITINESGQNKDFDYYHRMLLATFSEVYKVLKSGHYMTITFHHTEIKVFNSILEAIILSGFNLEKVLYQPSLRASDKALAQPYGSATGNYFLRFQKPNKKNKSNAVDGSIDIDKFEKVVVESTKAILAKRGEPTPYTYILNEIYVALDKNGMFIGAPQDPKSILMNHIDKEFQLVDIKDKENKVIGKYWWFKYPQSIPYLERIPLDERVEKALLNVLNRKIIVTYDEILQEIFLNFPNSLTPSTHTIKKMIDDYAEQTTDGRWRLKTSIMDQDSSHPKVIVQIAEIGKHLDFDVMIGKRELGDRFNGIKLSNWNDDIKLINIPDENLKRVNFIDVLWVLDGIIKFAFEVENTTTITEAIVRASNVPYDLNKIIVIPQSNINMFTRKFNEPMLKDKMVEWDVLYYETLEDLYLRLKKHKKKVDFKLFQSIINSQSSEEITGQRLLL